MEVVFSAVASLRANYRTASRAAIAFVAALFVNSAALALSMDKTSSMKDYCQAFLGADAVQMWGYLPDAPSHQYCEDIPATGSVILTFDLLTPQLREMQIETRIVRAPLKPIDENTDLAPITVARIEPKVYGSGVITLTHDFTDSGLYYAFITASDPATGASKTARFSFTVGRTIYFYLPALLAAVLLSGLVFAYWRHSAQVRPRG